MEKCSICGNKIEETFLGKMSGTVVKIKKGDKNEVFYVCNECQKKFKGKIKEELSKK
jgi:DNA-directed RNA polymerase subunit RPC12/RpoP